MKPTAVACHNGSQGKRWPSTSRKIRRQRAVRSGNVSVAVATAAIRRKGWARRMWPSTARGSTSCSVQYSSAAVTTSPATHAHGARADRLEAGGTGGTGGTGLGGEGNEVADFVDEGAERVAGGVLRLLAQLLRALECAVAAIQQRADVHDRGLDRAPRVERGRARCGARVLQRDEHLERRGADPRARQPLVNGPGPHQVGRLGDRLVGDCRRSGGR